MVTIDSRNWTSWCGAAGAVLLFVWTLLVLIFAAPAWLSWSVGVTGLLGAGVYVYYERAAVRKTLLSPHMRYGSNALLFAAGVAAIAILLNVIATRHSFRGDLTAEKFYSLSDQTRKVLKSLDQKVKVTAFLKAGSPEVGQIRDLLEEYKHLTSQLDVEIVDPDMNPDKAKQIYKITAYNTTVVESGDKRKDILPQEMFDYQFVGRSPQREFKGESILTSAIISVTQTAQRVVYFLEGHGEHSIDDTAENGISAMKQQLERDNYSVKTLNVLKEGKLPADADLVVIAGPKRAIPVPEVKLLAAYARGAGRLLVMLDPDTTAGLGPLLGEWGVKPLNGIAIDPRSFYYFGGIAWPIPSYRNHKITEDLMKNRIGTIFPISRALSAGKFDGGIATPLLETSSESWLETDPNLRAKPDYDSKTDTKGPLTMGVAVAVSATQAADEQEQEPASAQQTFPKLVAFADSDLIVNSKIQSVQDGGLDLVVNSVSWLLGAGETISVRPKQAQQRRMTLDNVSANLIGYTTIIFVPLAVIGIGVYRWWRRRSM